MLEDSRVAVINVQFTCQLEFRLNQRMLIVTAAEVDSPDSAMHSLMVLDVCVQQCLGNKCLATQFTLVWSLTCVVAHVN